MTIHIFTSIYIYIYLMVNKSQDCGTLSRRCIEDGVLVVDLLREVYSMYIDIQMHIRTLYIDIRVSIYVCGSHARRYSPLACQSCCQDDPQRSECKAESIVQPILVYMQFFFSSFFLFIFFFSLLPLSLYFILKKIGALLLDISGSRGRARRVDIRGYRATDLTLKLFELSYKKGRKKK